MPPQSCLRTFALAAIAAQLPTPIDDMPELQFLHSHLDCLQTIDLALADSVNWQEIIWQYIHHPLEIDLPLLSLVKPLQLNALELLTIALAMAVEEEVIVGRALARLQAPVGGSRPTLSLITAAFSSAVPQNTHPLHLLLTGSAVQSGLLTLSQNPAPLPERVVSLPLPLYLALNGQDSTYPGMAIGLADEAIPLPNSILGEAQRQAIGLQSTLQQGLVIRTGAIAEGKSVAEAIAQMMQCRPLFIETDDISSLAPLLLLRKLLPVFSLDLSPGERKLLPAIPFYRGAVLVLCGPDGTVETLGTTLNWSLPVPSRTEREQLWQQAIGNADAAAELARNHRHGSGRIASLGKLSRVYSHLADRPQPDLIDVITASRSIGSGGLDALAQPLRDEIPDETLVMPPTLQRELNTLLQRCLARDRLVDGLGVSAATRYYPGVRALFVGPSGTGKTLAASWLATKLGIPLFRVDLSAVTSKYIGETEKNLAQLLARAEQAEVILLFDEADSTFGKRTDVKDSNDRFANAQTNYLLQRIESFDGITILTSNSRNRLDSAFSRRLDVIIDFPLPGLDERRSLWLSHLGSDHQLAADQINQLAATADLGGGHIRNVVLAAAVLAQSENRSIAFSDVVQGLAGEYRKLGRQSPTELKVG
ncbi:ATP-binding protein [Leptolyngbya ohadii]|uniref:ATP-binding protein n=1 Tax=Leptolyngbya ohadii TaxID=1962290 RepID=UPI000B59B555|nr:ATP-binding protein [Leptolyngbya ohadii]